MYENTCIIVFAFAAVISSPMKLSSSFDEAFDAVDRNSDYCIIKVNVTMKKVYEYENRMSTVIEIESKVTRGLTTKEQNKKSDKSTESIEVSAKAGVKIKIIELELSAKYGRSNEISQEVMSETELRSGEEFTVKWKIPPGKTLTRWQVVANVTDEARVYGKFIDTDQDLTEEMKESKGKGEAKIYLPRKIVYGETQFRIKHKGTNKYLITALADVGEMRPDVLMLRRDVNYYFKLEKYPNGVKIRAANCTYSKYMYCYATAFNFMANKFFDDPAQPGQVILLGKNGHDLSQIWIINKEGQLRNGDVVTFRNRYWENADLCYADKGDTTDVFCQYNSEDEWILEM